MIDMTAAIFTAYIGIGNKRQELAPTIRQYCFVQLQSLQNARRQADIAKEEVLQDVKFFKLSKGASVPSSH